MLAPLKVFVLALATFWSFSAFAADLPTPTLTPGDVLAVTAADICKSGYAKAARNVSASLKTAVYRSYGLTGNHTGYCAVDGGCEVDHLISLELGGSNKITNLWPEPYAGSVWNARTKDRLENYLHAEVCAGRMTLQSAQHDIAVDWVAAYVRYLGEPTVATPRRCHRRLAPHLQHVGACDVRAWEALGLDFTDVGDLVADRRDLADRRFYRGLVWMAVSVPFVK